MNAPTSLLDAIQALEEAAQYEAAMKAVQEHQA